MLELRVAIALLLTSALALIVIPPRDIPSPEITVEAISVVRKVAPEPKTEKELRQELIIKNPNKCDQSIQWIVWPDGECSDKTVVTKTVPSGDWVAQCKVWATQAGVTLDSSAIKLLERESHCNPTVRNPHSSAGGLPQALPWTKMGCELSYADAPCQIKWFYNYVMNRYGSYASALSHSYATGWY